MFSELHLTLFANYLTLMISAHHWLHAWSSILCQPNLSVECADCASLLVFFSLCLFQALWFTTEPPTPASPYPLDMTIAVASLFNLAAVVMGVFLLPTWDQQADLVCTQSPTMSLTAGGLFIITTFFCVFTALYVFSTNNDSHRTKCAHRRKFLTAK